MADIIDAMIVGAEKAGTTSLLRYLGQHPQVAIPGKYSAGMDNFDSGLEFGEFLSDDRAQPERLQASIQTEFGKVPDVARVRLAKNVGIMYEPDAMIRLKDHNPDVKTIAMLRSPVARAFSSFRYQQFRGEEKLTCFDEALRREKSCDSDQLSIHTRYAFKSSYVIHLQNLDKVFGDASVYVMTLERFQAEPASEYRNLCRYLDIDTDFVPDFSVHSNVAKSPRIRWLADLLYRDSLWKRVFRRATSKEARKRMYMFIRSANSRESDRGTLSAAAKRELAQQFSTDLASLSERVGYDIREYWKRDFEV